MAEALGIASGIAGIISLGITICSGLDTYFSAIKDRDDDLKRASDLLNLLRTYIGLIESKAATLGSRHAQATGLVILALKFCESELRALKELVDGLNKLDSSSDVTRKWDRSKSVITYPFQRKKLTQVQDQLVKATGTLGTIVQPLILNVGLGVGEDLDAFKSAVQDNHLVTTAFLTRLESKVKMIESCASHTESTLTAISAGIEEQKALASSSQAAIKGTSLMVSRKLDAMAQGPWFGPQSQTGDTGQQKDVPLYLKNAAIESECIQETTTELCPCQRQNGGTGSHPLATYRYWGGLAISYQARSKGGHHPRCCFYKRSTKTTITYTGLRFLLSKVVSFSLQSDYQGGSHLITHMLRTHNVRETSPAFNIFEDFRSVARGVDLTAVIQKKIKELQLAYTSGKASPLDVDIFGHNAAHMCVLEYHMLIRTRVIMMNTEASESLKMMLLFLQHVGVDVYAGTNSNSSMIGFVFGQCASRTLGPVYDVLAKRESQFDPGQDEKRAEDLFLLFRTEFKDALQERPDIMEGLGYNNFFLAVAKRDEARLKELIQNIKFVEYVRETDFFGQNILHFCVNWETGLRLLLEKEATHYLVNQPDTRGVTPLMDALELSDRVCRGPYGPDLCSGCGCSVAVRLLLETDCPVGFNLIANLPLFLASPKANIVILEHLGQRRERLRKLALHHLPEPELRDLEVSLNQLPDTTAPAVWEKLQSLHQSGVVKVLHNGLSPGSGRELANHSRQGIFHLLQEAAYAGVALNLGFQDINTPDRDGVTPIIRSALRSSYFSGLKEIILYANWLIGNGARIDDCINPLGISAAHDLACRFGQWVHEYSRKRCRVDELSTECVTVLSALIYSTAESRLPCPCATEELSRPLHYVVASSLSYMGTPVSPNVHTIPFADQPVLAIRLLGYLRIIASDLDVTYLAKSIIRVLTMEALSISHLPQCREWPIYSRERVQEVKEEEEWDAMLDEDPILIDNLNKLSQEFEQEFFNRNLSIEDFLQLHWHPKMRQVLGQIRRERKAVDESYRKELRRVGVVLDDEFEQDVYSDSDDTSEWDDDSEYDDSEDDD